VALQAHDAGRDAGEAPAVSAWESSMATGFEKLMRAAGTATARMRRDLAGGPVAKTPVAAMLEAEEVAALDAWIAARPEPRPSRAEAARLLIAEALGVNPARG